MKQKKCKSCKSWFSVSDGRPFQVVCDNVDCAVDYAMILKEKQQSQTRKAFNQRKIAFKANDKSLLKKKAQAKVNEWVRLRDRNKPCVSCGHIKGRQFHAGHYKPMGANPQLRYNTLNIHRQCSVCNNFNSGNLVPYRVELIKRIGLEKVEEIERNKSVVKYDSEYLKRLIRVFSKKIKLYELKFR